MYEVYAMCLLNIGLRREYVTGVPEDLWCVCVCVCVCVGEGVCVCVVGGGALCVGVCGDDVWLCVWLWWLVSVRGRWSVRKKKKIHSRRGRDTPLSKKHN